MKRWIALLGVLAAVGLFRVFAPAETVSGVTGPLPSPPTRGPGVVATLPWMPLLVDGRLRVYADGRQVHADGPIDSRVQTTPYWSFRRWPARVVEAVTAGGVVVSRWSDGELVALDARTGAVRWRASGPATAALHTAGDLAVVVGPGQARGYRASDGGLAWSRAAPGCSEPSFTTTTGLVGLTCAGGEVRLLDGPVLGRGDPEPLGCATAASVCHGVRIGGQAWLLDGRTPVPAPALSAAGTRLVDGIAVLGRAAEILGAAASTGAARWRVPLAGAVVATQPGRVHVLTDDLELVTLDAATGAERSRFRYVADDGAVDWDPGLSYAADGYVATRRLHEPEYPYPVILAAT